MADAGNLFQCLGNSFSPVKAVKGKVHISQKVAHGSFHLQVEGYLHVENGNKNCPSQAQGKERQRQALFFAESIAQRNQQDP